MSLVLLTATVLHVILASTVFQASAHPRCIHDTLQIAPHFDSATSLKRESNLGPPTRSDGLRIFIDWSPVNNPNVDVNRTCTQEKKKVAIGNPINDRECRDGFVNDCYYECTERDIPKEASIAKMNNTILAAKSFFESILHVKHYRILDYRRQKDDDDTISFDLSKSCGCGSGNVKPTNTKWENADLVLLLTANPTIGQVVAWACACQYDDLTGRPIVGQVNIGLAALMDSNLDSNVRVVIHEILHVLAMSSQAFDYFLDDNGKSYPFQTVMDADIIGDDGIIVAKPKVLATPRVALVARQHFNCSEMTGAELEALKEPMSIGSHWEKRVWDSEIMTAIVTSYCPPQMSLITLSMLHDTGWYKVVSFSAAEEGPFFGRHENCMVPLHDCQNWPSSLVCEQPSHEITCTEDRRNTAICSLRPLSKEELNERENLIESDALANSVEEGEVGGADWYDFCPIWDASRLSANRLNKSLVENQCLKPTVEVDSIYQRRCFEVSTANGLDHLLLNTVCKDGVYDVILSENEKVSCSGPSDLVNLNKPPDGKLHCIPRELVCEEGKLNEGGSIVSVTPWCLSNKKKLESIKIDTISVLWRVPKSSALGTVNGKLGCSGSNDVISLVTLNKSVSRAPSSSRKALGLPLDAPMQPLEVRVNFSIPSLDSAWLNQCQALDIIIDFELHDIEPVNAAVPWYLRKRRFQGYRAISLNCPIYDEGFSRLADVVILSACALAAGVMSFSTNRFLKARSEYSQLRRS